MLALDASVATSTDAFFRFFRKKLLFSRPGSFISPTDASLLTKKFLSFSETDLAPVWAPEYLSRSRLVLPGDITEFSMVPSVQKIGAFAP